MKLQSKINLSTSVMFIILLLIINGAIYLSFSKMLMSNELKNTAEETVRAVKGMNLGLGSVPSNDLLRAYAPINGKLQIVKTDGSTDGSITSSNQHSLIDQTVIFYQKEERHIIEYEGVPYTFISIPFIWSGGEVANLQMTQNLEGTTRILKTLEIVLIAVTLIAAILTLISTRLLSNFITRPITSMINTMKDIRSSGKFKRIHLPNESKDEFYQMGSTFNNMMDQLESNYEKQEQFVANASHELKTPLTVIESYASLLKRRGMEKPELFFESVEAIHSEAIRMKELTQQLLMLARNDEKWDVEEEEIELDHFLEISIRSFQAAFQRRVDYSSTDQMNVRTDRQKLKQLLYIFLDNARKYSDDYIIVRTRKEGNNAIIEITDKGMGIPAAELPHVFDRLYRVDKARTSKSGGFGLGLSLAKEIADALNVELRLESVEGQWTTAQIWMELFQIPSQNSR